MSFALEMLRKLIGVWRSVDFRTAVSYTTAVLKSARRIIHTKSLLPADHLMTKPTYAFRAWGTTLTVQGAQFSGAREIMGTRVYFPDRRFCPESGDTVVDLGANVGLFTTFAARRGCRVIAVEAQSGFVPEIHRNLDLNDCREEVSVEVALMGAGAGLFADPAERSLSSHWGDEPQILVMDELMARHGFDTIDFLKIDIEGSEFALFRDASSWIGRVRRIAMEVHPGYGSEASLLQTLETHTSQMDVSKRSEGKPFMVLTRI